MLKTHSSFKEEIGSGFWSGESVKFAGKVGLMVLAAQKCETFRGQVGFGSGKGAVPLGLLELALPSQLPGLFFHTCLETKADFTLSSSLNGESKLFQGVSSKHDGILWNISEGVRIYALWTETSNLTLLKRVHLSH